jgi:LEA14-like dessication related protein
MDVRESLLGSKLRVAATVVGALVVVLVGAFVAGVIGVPSVVGVENSFGTVNESATVIHTNLTVHNPNPVGITLGGVGVNYSVEMNDVQMATGVKSGIGVGAGNSTIEFVTLMQNEKIPRWWVSHLQNGERTDLTVQATVSSATLGQSVTKTPVRRSIDTDLLSSFNSSETRPVNADAPLVSDPVMYVNETAGWWGDVSAAETPVVMEFVVYNPKPYPVTVTELGYDVTMGGVDMGEGATERTYVVEPGTTERLRATVVLDNSKLDEWWVSHLQSDQRSLLKVDFYARASVQDTSLRIPLNAFTYEKAIETDLFGGGSGSGNTTDGGGNQTTTEGGGQTTTDGGLLGGEDTTTDGGLLGGDGTTTDETTTTSGDTATSGDTTTDDGLIALARPQ